MSIWNVSKIIGYCCLVVSILFPNKTISQELLVQPEIWLLYGSECNVCEIFDKTNTNRAYKDSITVQNVKFLIRKINKDDVPNRYKHLVGEILEGNEYWPVQLNIAVTQGDTVLYHGNIAESADWRNGVIDKKYMHPPITATLDELHSYGFNYSEFFEQEFNLEHFARRALNPLERDDFNARLDQWSAKSNSTTPNTIQVSILGTAKQPAANGLFISTRIKQLQAIFNKKHLVTTYANGVEKYRDTLVKQGNKYEFISSDINAKHPSDLGGMNNWLQNIAASKHNRQLVIQVGHSGPTGMPIWGSALTVTPNALKTGFDKTDKHITFVSGACHSGLFANVAQCGYFAAHPDAISTGCQTSLDAIESSDDYLKYFFLQDTSDADANGDKQISFQEAHWYASSKLERHNISYSDSDATIDEYFAAHPNKLGQTISVLNLSAYIKKLSRAEQLAYEKLSDGLPSDVEINLRNYVSLHKQAIEKLKDHTEGKSVDRNLLSELEYPLNLVILARRALYASFGEELDPVVEACANDSMTNYL